MVLHSAQGIDISGPVAALYLACLIVGFLSVLTAFVTALQVLGRSGYTSFDPELENLNEREQREQTAARWSALWSRPEFARERKRVKIAMTLAAVALVINLSLGAFYEYMSRAV